MGNRCLSLDFLRGVSIFGMIFSAIVPSGVLPAWMYHIQNPPPSHALDISVSGIGWVDLVFPLFIFCMGVAIPLSGRNKIGHGCTAGEYIKGVFARFFMLWLFSYLYVLLNFSTADGFWPQLFTLFGFFALFPLYRVYRKEGKGYSFCGMNISRTFVKRGLGVLLVFYLIVIGHFEFGEVISVHRRGIIIFLLAFLYLFGSLIWYFTRNSINNRVVLFVLLLLFVHVTRILDWPAITYANPNVRWWFNMEYFYFLLVLIPATIVGDMLCGTELKRAWSREYFNRKNISHLLFPSLLLFVIWQCIALYMNMAYWNIALSILFCISGFFIVRKYFRECGILFMMASVLLLYGLFFIQIEGGISKVPCTVGYCLVTCGISMILLLFSFYLCAFCDNSFLVGIFSGAGKNPLMSYIAFGNFVMPLLHVTGAITLYNALYLSGSPLSGTIRAAVMVIFTMWIVSWAGKKNIYWKA